MFKLTEKMADLDHEPLSSNDEFYYESRILLKLYYTIVLFYSFVTTHNQQH